MQPSEASVARIAISKMLTIQQAAEILSLRPVTLRAWAARRKIAIYRLGRAIRVPRTEIERLLQQSLVPALPEERMR
jgi:excisionase family DNA binding protein